jgi:hypothetical protein
MVSVDTAGNVAFRGKLNDGTPLVEKTFVSTSAQWPLYASLYGNKGLLIGWLSFLTTPGSDVAGAVSWIKLPQPQTQFYPAGFTNETETIGSIYRFTNGFPALNWRTGQVAMVSASILTQNITNRVTLNPTNNTWAGEEDLKFRINAPTGLFNGRTANPSTGKAVVFNGVVLQRQNTGFGYFLGRHQTGVVLVQSAK